MGGVWNNCRCNSRGDRLATKYGAARTVGRTDHRLATDEIAASGQCSEKDLEQINQLLPARRHADVSPGWVCGYDCSDARKLLDLFIKFLQPITVSWLHLPNDPRIATTFILGIVRRDFASFGLTEVPLTPVQAVTAMIVITLFVPCIATVGVMIKERGPKVALTIWFGSWACAFVIGGLLSQVLPFVFRPFGL